MTVLNKTRRHAPVEPKSGVAMAEAQMQAIVDAEIDAQVLVLPSNRALPITHANDAARQLLGSVATLPEVGSLHWACHDLWSGGRPVNLTDVRWPGQDAWFDIRIRKLFGRISVTFVDVTARHQSLDALLDSKFRYRLLAEHAGDLVFQVRGRRVEWVSSSVHEVLGWEHSEVVGRRVVEIVHPDDHDRVIEGCSDPKAATIFEARFRHRDGHYVPLSVEMRPAEDLGGSVARVGSCRCV